MLGWRFRDPDLYGKTEFNDYLGFQVHIAENPSLSVETLGRCQDFLDMKRLELPLVLTCEDTFLVSGLGS